MFYGYILKNKDGKIYTGSTGDLQGRIQEHADGKSFYTRINGPWELIYYEAFATEKLARLREQKLKYSGNAIRELKKRIVLRDDKSGAGFTLIETLIYAGIVAAMLFFTMLIAYQAIDSADRLKLQRELVENQEFLIQKLTWVLQSNLAVVTPLLGSSGPTLSVTKLNFTNNPLVVGLSGSAVWLTAGAGSPVNLTNRYVTVTGLNFEHLNLSGSGAIRFQATIANGIATNTIDTTISLK